MSLVAGIWIFISDLRIPEVPQMGLNMGSSPFWKDENMIYAVNLPLPYVYVFVYKITMPEKAVSISKYWTNSYGKS